MRTFAALVACFLLAACSGLEFKKGEKSHARRDNPPGPGLFTGDKGEFVIFRVQDKDSAQEKNSNEAAPQAE